MLFMYNLKLYIAHEIATLYKLARSDDSAECKSVGKLIVVRICLFVIFTSSYVFIMISHEIFSLPPCLFSCLLRMRTTEKIIFIFVLRISHLIVSSMNIPQKFCN